MRQRRERGLPGAKALVELSRAWLETQRQHWASLADTQILPKPTAQVLEKMAEQFRENFVSETIANFDGPEGTVPWKALGASYVRYSSEHQHPRSLYDQLHLQLERAARDRIFIPWQYVFADAGVSGTEPDRNGYNLAKKCLGEKQRMAAVLYIDEIGRASRDAIEALLLGRLVENLQKRMVGVSDGFDSDSPVAKMQLHMLAMVNEWFVDQLRSKVKRGLSGSLRRRGVHASVPLGFKTGPKVDETGKPILDENGYVKKRYIVVPEELQILQEIARLFVDERWSTTKIVKYLNTIQAGGRRNWQPCTILQQLDNHFYAGIIISNRFHVQRDSVTGKKSMVEQDRKEWRVHRDKAVQVWPWRRWKQIQARLSETKGTREKGCRNRVYPNNILSGVLFCGYCGNELTLWHSQAKRKQFYCRNGRHGIQGCGLDSSKSLEALAAGILGHVKAKVLTPEHIQRVVEQANSYLAQEAKKPRVDTSGLEQTLREAIARRERLALAIEQNPEMELQPLVSRLNAAQVQVKQLDKQIAEAKAIEDEHLPPLDEKHAIDALDDLRALLEQEPTAAALALQRLLGRVLVKQMDISGRKRKAWILRIEADLVPSMAQLTADRQSPDSYTWGKLLLRKWNFMNYEEIIIGGEAAPHVTAASKVVALAKEGHTIKEAAKILGISYACALQAYHVGVGDADDPKRTDLRGRAWFAGRKSPQRRRRQ